MKRAVAAIYVMLLWAAPSWAQAPRREPGRCASSPPMSDPTTSARWNGWSAGVTNTRFQPADQAGLTAGQVPSLKLKWAFGFPEATIAYSQPTAAGGRVFVGSQSGAMYSLDAKTGCIHWTFNAQTSIRTAATVGPRKLSNGRAAYALYFGDLQAHVYALDAGTGDLLWARKVDDHPTARVTGAPTLYQDRLYVPVASLEEAAARSPEYRCCTFRGSLVALDAGSGTVVWKTFTIAEEAKPIAKASTGQQRFGPAGAGIWSSPTIDVARRAVYVATGNMYSEPQQPTSDAVLAIDLDSGKIKWVAQLLPKDVWIVGCEAPNPNCPSASELGPDFDLGSSPMLAKLPNMRDAIVVGQKSGVGWALDPDKRGAVIWQYRAGQGGTLGGIEWGPAVDSERAYFAVSDVRQPSPGGLHAVRLDTGQRAWYAAPPPPRCGSIPGCDAAQTAAITVIPGVVFSGSSDGVLRAYATTDGSIVWEVDTNRPFDTVNGVRANGASIGGPGPTVVSGMVYVNSGYGGPAGRAGNVLLAFGVD